MIRLHFLFLTICLLFPLSAAASVTNLSPGEANALLQENQHIFLLDVRTPGEYRGTRLAGARLIPIDQIAERQEEIPVGRPVLIYCAVGSRSAKAAAYLDRQGFPEVYNLFGGIWAWRLRGFPILKGGP